MEFVNFVFSNAFILIFLPIWVALLITLNFTVPSFRSKKFTTNLTLVSTGIGVVYSLSLLIVTTTTGIMLNENIIDWLRIGNITFSYGFLLDNLSALFAFILTFSTFLIQLFSLKFMEDDECFHRYFVYLNIFNFAASSLIVSPNLVQTYIFSILTGACLYLLASFWFKKKDVSKSSFKMLIFNAIADVPFLLGLVALLYFALGYFPESGFMTLNISILPDLGQGVIPYATDCGFFIICFLLVFSIFVKMAQFPLHVIYTHNEKMPAPFFILNGITGAYLFVRLLPLLNMSLPLMKTVFYFGMITAFFASISAFIQNDLKKIFTYAFCSQAGFILILLSTGFIASGLYQTSLITFDLILLFLVSNIIIKINSGISNIKEMGGLFVKCPKLSVLLIFGLLILSGILVGTSISNFQILNYCLGEKLFVEFGVVLVSLILTICYCARVFCLVCEGSEASESGDYKINLPIKISIGALLLPIVLFNIRFFNSLFEVVPKIDISYKNYILNLVVIFAVAGFVYWLNKIEFLKNSPKFIDYVADKELFMNDIYKYLFKVPYKFVCKIAKYIDKYIIGGFEKLLKYSFKVLTVVVSKMQTGSLQVYLLYSLIGLCLSLAFVVFYYFKIKGL